MTNAPQDKALGPDRRTCTPSTTRWTPTTSRPARMAATTTRRSTATRRPGSGRSRTRKQPSALSGRKYRKRDLVRIDGFAPRWPSASDATIRTCRPTPRSASANSRYRMLYVEELLQQEHGEFSELDREVAEKASPGRTRSPKTREEEFEEHRTSAKGCRITSPVLAGSWAFLMSFGAVVVRVG